MTINEQYDWGHARRYNDFSSYIKKKFNGRIQKISIDAGFTCPNRDGKSGIGGCTYCNNKTFKPTYCELEVPIKEQIEKGIAFFDKKYPSIHYLAYFQAYTNTYADLENLIALYSEALKHPKVVGLVIATRPDCLPPDILHYLHKLSKKYYVMIELGVESCKDKTLERINRGHTFAQSVDAIENLARLQIHNCAHMILGLPGENRQDVLNQAKEMSKLPVENMKLHQLQIHRHTVMEKQYAQKPEEFHLYQTVDEYIDLVIQYLELLRPQIILERFISQSPPELLIAPRWGLKNFEFVTKLEKELNKRNTWQGRLYQ